MRVPIDQALDGGACARAVRKELVMLRLAKRRSDVAISNFSVLVQHVPVGSLILDMDGVDVRHLAIGIQGKRHHDGTCIWIKHCLPPIVPDDHLAYGVFNNL